MRNPAKLTLATPSSASRARRSARRHDVHRPLDTPDELTDQRVIREPNREHAIGPRLKASRASHRLLEQLAAIALAAQHIDPRVQDDIDAGLGRRDGRRRRSAFSSASTRPAPP